MPQSHHKYPHRGAMRGTDLVSGGVAGWGHSDQVDEEIRRAERGPLGTHSYLSPKCIVSQCNDRGGHSVFAAGPIEKGELIVVWSGKLVDRATLESLPASVRRYSLQVEEDNFLVSLTDCEPADYVNHSCAPNAGLSGQIALVALRHIAEGEEITYDYSMSDGSAYDEFQCLCGSPECRGRVSGDDWRLPEVQVRYSGHFSPYLERRIAKEQAARRRLSATTARRRFLRMLVPVEHP